MKSKLSPLSAISILLGTAVSLAAWNSSASDQTPSPTQQTSASARKGVKFLPKDESYVLVSESVKRFTRVDRLTSRRSGSAFSGTSIARPRFASETASQTLGRLREAAHRFFSATNRTQGSTVDLAALATALPRAGLPFLALDLGDTRVSAGACPESTVFLLRHVASKLPHSTSVTDPNEAVNIALSFVADRSLLSLQHGEGLDVINVQALYESETDEAGFGPIKKVAHHVAFGRTYKGHPIDGGMMLIAVDSDGMVSTFHKGWRDIVGEDQVKLASEDTIQARRDPDKAKFLVEKERTCVLTEDPDPSATHEAAGIGCKFVYSDPMGGSGLSSLVTEWVNAADDAGIPLKGKKSINPVSR